VPRAPLSQFTLFDGEEPVPSPAAARVERPAPSGAEDGWLYPPGAFPPDPWPPFLAEAAEEFAASQGDAAAVRVALCRFFRRGAVLASPPELIDALGISAGSVLECAGLTDDEALEVMRLMGTLTPHEIDAVS
jgi:hypothetical protein